MKITPLDKWTKEKTKGDIAAYQLEKLNETLNTAQSASYYRQTLPPRIESLAELKTLPLIDSATLTRNGTELICAPQHEISRIVTLRTSGTTAAPKRLYFTEEDQELTIDYFANGLPTVAGQGATMAILLPSERPGGVGDLIARALERIPIEPIRHGPVADLDSCAKTLRDSKSNSLVGTPIQALALARYCEATNTNLDIRGILLSADHIPNIARLELKRIWGCEVYEHYGMTEMGLGGAIDCDAHDGYHIRENDLLFEILDENGNPLPDGETGEIAFTTLTRRGMPLVRYKTGDLSAIIPGQCPCGSTLKRIAPITGRINSDITIPYGCTTPTCSNAPPPRSKVIRMRDFDEVLFSIHSISDYWLTASPSDDALIIDIDTQEFYNNPQTDKILQPTAIKDLLTTTGLTVGIKTEIKITRHPNTLTQHPGKRTIMSRKRRS